MPSKSAGKTIVKVKVNKKNVVITFNDRSKLDLSPEVMANFYIYEGKQISQKEIKEIKEYSENIALLRHAMSLIKKRHYSEWKMREKLYAQEADKKAVDKVIKTLKNVDLINDAALAEDLKCYLEEKNYGQNRILNCLNNEGIFDDTLKGLRFPTSNERKKALANLPKLEKRYAKYPYEQKKQHIYNALINLGFANEIAMDALNKAKEPNQKEENEKLDKDFPKVMNKYQRKYEGRELKEKVIASLRNKGYKMKDILRKLEKYYDQNDFGI